MPARILIVEDNATNLDLMAYLLGAHGHEVVGAGDGAEGLEQLQRERFDLILTDVLMPRMDGFAFVTRAKHDAGAACPIVAVTALAMVGDRDRIVDGGFDGYIAKPIDPESFVHEVDGFLAPTLRSSGASRAPSDAESSVSGAMPRGRTILVVDDVPTNALVVRAALEPFGYTIVDARSAADAIAAARRLRPDLVLTDVHMPDASGYDLIRAFKDDATLADIPFVFLSSTYWHESERARGLALGAKRFLLRPIDPRTLVEEIGAALDGLL